MRRLRVPRVLWIALFALAAAAALTAAAARRAHAPAGRSSRPPGGSPPATRPAGTTSAPATRPAAGGDRASRSAGIAAEVRGVTISCPRAGQIWATDAMVESYRELKDLGVEWVAIHPYAGIRKDGSVPQWLSLEEPPAWITRPIAEAHRLGLKIFIKPHLGYWGSGFSWRGEITFDEDEHWLRFFREYEVWITRLAEICRDADLFAIGTELDATLHREGEWRRIARGVRAHFKGPITYAANWSHYEQVPFWDAVDLVGIQAYFPLVADGEKPTREHIERGWRELGRRLAAARQRFDRPILFTELGYNLSASAARTPWDDRTGGADAARIQRDCLTAALDTVHREPAIAGAFLWKWFPGRWTPRNFSLHTPAMCEVIRAKWGGVPR